MIVPHLQIRSKPTVLIILQGQHHLTLYRELFVRCQQFHWVCLFEKPRELPSDLVNKFHALYGVQIFTDERTALTNFLGIDAVISTFAVPHAAHSHHIHHLALAYEMGLPVFEMQHGLFQLGISCSERSALVGSGLSGALSSLNAPNLTQHKFIWGESRTTDEISIGYPPYVNDIVESTAYIRTQAESVLVASNMHWNILDEDDVAQAWDYLVHLFKHLPDIPFVMMPHPGEMKSASLQRGLERCRLNGINNLEVKRPEDRDEFIAMLAATRVAISTISTVLLDFEMYEMPCVILPCEKQKHLVAALQHAQYPRSKQEFVSQVCDTYYASSQSVLRTGALQKFRPDRLERAILDAMPQEKMVVSQAVPLIAKYLQGVK